MKDLIQIVKYVWNYIKEYKWKIYVFVSQSILVYLMDLLTPFLLGSLIDNILIVQSVKTILICSVVFAVTKILYFILCYCVKISGQRVMVITSSAMCKQIAHHVQESSLKNAAKTGAAALIRRLWFYSSSLITFVENFFIGIIGKICVCVIAIVMIFQRDVVCGIMMMIEIPVVALLYLKFKDVLLERERVLVKKEEKYFCGLYDMLLNVKHIKMNHIFSLVSKRYDEATEEKIEAEVAAYKIDYVYNMVLENLAVFLQIFLFFYGGLAIINGNMTVGDFTIIYSYFELVNEAVLYFLGQGKEVQVKKSYYECLAEITDCPKETNGKEMLSRIESIELKDIGFKYEGDVIFKDFSCSLEKGKLYVLAGENGSGKSTAVALMLGLYIDEFEGEITYNQKSIKQLDMRNLRKEKIGVCEQEPYLFDDTIRYNVIYSNDTSKDAELMELASKVSLQEFLKSTEKGLDTRVGDNGDALSGGQKQKTALMKVFYKNPDVLVLDEPTSAMDKEGKERFVNYLQTIKQDKIIIMVTHEVELMDIADEVIEVRKFSGGERMRNRNS